MVERRAQFEDMYVTYADNLYNMAIKLTGQASDAEDLVQETFTRAWKRFAEFKSEVNPKAWLFKIMHNIFIDHYRKKHREPDLVHLKDDVINQLQTMATAGENWLSQVLDKEIQEALDELPEEFKTAVILSDIEEFSCKEISGILGCPAGTVRSRICRGRRMLLDKLRNYSKERGYIK